MMALDAELCRDVEDFLTREARMLDERRFEEWMDLFAEDGYYWAPARPGQQDPWHEVSLFFDDREIMADRIARLRHPKIYAQLPPSRAVRQVSNTVIDGDGGDDTVTAHSTFFMFEHRPTLPQPIERVFAGHVTHCLRRAGDGFKIAWKKVMVANCDATHDPMFVYF
ncbi:MAG: aromatic-ring-hydroxylating dioxygenase subunit beta [Pigmentiphaga sp.]|uniref:aromatic-ring-hydroxylating dioxygenase subunit beta n=1 Tax=Pigmentiphaga sp. TaxID=1977564 RepID=UPI0029A97BEF|nr:aromatic-ring-hydroxylating dioxygenase subunit beta [Pigmentiphaga sp.]MDX3905445.1 aromatic-ring-hydroxylating dioxygenase subunit beta [Pigmentiphaga sp.]